MGDRVDLEKEWTKRPESGKVSPCPPTWEGASKKYGKMTFKYRYSNNGLEKTGEATVLKNS